VAASGILDGALDGATSERADVCAGVDRGVGEVADGVLAVDGVGGVVATTLCWHALIAKHKPATASPVQS